MAAQETERKVKGTLVIALAMIVNDRKNLDWKGQTLLTDKDLAIIKDRIMASSWYDIGFYERLGSAVFKLVGGGRPEGAYQFGEGIMWNILVKIYASSLLKNDPSRALAGFSMLYKGIFFNTGSSEYKAGEAGGVFKISDPLGIPTQESFVPMVKSLLAKIVLENGARNVKVECEQENVLKTEKLKSVNYKISWDKAG
jgi:hypothetical protein